MGFNLMCSTSLPRARIGLAVPRGTTVSFEAFSIKNESMDSTDLRSSSVHGSDKYRSEDNHGELKKWIFESNLRMFKETFQ